MQTAKKNIIQRIENALQKKEEKPFPELEDGFQHFKADQQHLKELFIQTFSDLDGQLIPCENKKQLKENLEKIIKEKQWTAIHCSVPELMKYMDAADIAESVKNMTDDMEVGITDCECLVARTGTVVLTAAQRSGRTIPVYAPIHVIIASENSIVYNVDDAIQMIKAKYRNRFPSAIFFASGPSRTADIEKKLVLGIHGPRQIYVFLLSGENVNE